LNTAIKLYSRKKGIYAVVRFKFFKNRFSHSRTP